MLKNPKDASKRRECSRWSHLPPDLIRPVFQRLSFGDFERGKSVCSSWHSASRSCYPKNQIPWLILFPDEYNCCKLVNPEEKDKIYTTQDLGFGFANNVCVATYGCWLLMQNDLFNLYIVDLLTGERINLPPVESQLGKFKLERIVDNKFRLTTTIGSIDSRGVLTDSHQLWVDEETKDYLVMWSFGYEYVVICKKGDNLWRQIPDCSGIGKCRDMVYKDHKLYVYNSGDSTIRISDFSGELPQKVPETIVAINLDHMDQRILNEPFAHGYKDRLVVTVNGDVLMVKSTMSGCGIWLCEIYGMNSSTKEWEKVVTLGDEAMLLDLGITVLAKDIPGINKNSIYFSGLGWDEKQIFVFDLETKKFERPYQSVCSAIQNCSGRWFFPNFSRKRLI